MINVLLCNFLQSWLIKHNTIDPYVNVLSFIQMGPDLRTFEAFVSFSNQSEAKLKRVFEIRTKC